ncbi:MAG: hypothetical protein JHC84_09745 [Solirubrobacteraceae bacterium]|nr:hypothetical protein [Solirubrobacteraceae bacterium]
MPDAWVETASAHVVARHDGRDTRDAEQLVGELEALCARTADLLGIAVPDEIALVLHGTPLQLDLAQPPLALVRAATHPDARRIVVGWARPGAVHVLAPRVLRDRAAHDGPDEREFLRLAPGALLVQALVGSANPKLQSRRALLRPKWAWLLWGAGQLIGGQTAYARGFIRRRLRSGDQPSFPPGLGDAPLLGGSVLDLLRREEGMAAVGRLLTDPLPRTADEALRTAFGGRATMHSAGTWRAHLARLAEGAER